MAEGLHPHSTADSQNMHADATEQKTIQSQSVFDGSHIDTAAGMFYFVATPIGNLKDITLRALETLKLVDIIVCEDTRHSLKLLNHYDIKKPLMSYHKHNSREAGAAIIQKLRQGKTLALITDAGTPGISDPGQELVPLLLQNGIKYTVLPGAAAFVNALVLSGFDSAGFMFCGFIPQKSNQRKDFMQEICRLGSTLIFYSAPHDVHKDIDYLYQALGDRRFAAVREISKIYEQVSFSTLAKGLEGAKGEYVLIVQGAEKSHNPYAQMDLLQHLLHYIDSGQKPAEAVKSVAKDRGLPKGEVYAEYVALKQQGAKGL